MLYKGTITAVQIRLQRQGGYRSRPDGKRGAALHSAEQLGRLLAEQVLAMKGHTGREMPW